MKFIDHDKLYDTDKAEHLGTYKISTPYLSNKRVDLYRSPKGTFFTIDTLFGVSFYEVLTEKDAKNLLNRANDVDTYIKVFGAEEG